ncbi:MAG: DNA topoisomerase I [Candidatus Nanohaloarchaea archaeon]|nr:DNA topoisomerase I [Candidatus Nanohaloarchaea archaeon]
MGTTLLVAEKPKVAGKIAHAIGDYSVEENRGVKNYRIDTDKGEVVIAPAVGHVFNLKQKDGEWTYPVFDVEWVPAYEENDSADYMEKYVENLKDKGKEADHFINGCDFDIEGSVIGFSVIKMACNGSEGNIERMKFSTLTKSELKNAFDNLNEFDRGQTEAGLTRHVLDWYYGINLSRALMIAVKSQGRYKSLSTGRVQGPALKIAAEREKKIQEFEPEPYWELYLHTNGLKAEHARGKFWEEEVALDVVEKCEGEGAVVTDISRKKYKHYPPNPFNLTDLQKEAYSKHGIPPKKTQQLAHNLYENSLISYPRTSSQRLPASIGYSNILGRLKKQDKYRELAERVLGKNNLSPNNGKKKDKAHPAIHPTGLNPGKKLSKQERKVYDLIVKRFLATFGKAAVRQKMEITLDVEGEKFSAQGKKTLKRNWYDLYSPYMEPKNISLPDLEEGAELDVEELEKEDKETQPPNRYTQSSLVSKLEKKGLGTKATRAPTIDSLYNRKYIKSRPIEVTDLGMSVVKALENHCRDILSEELTRKFEERLEEIREGDISREDVLEEARETLQELLEKFREEEDKIGEELVDAVDRTKKKERQLGDCDQCDGKLKKISTKNGRFVGCSNYPDCQNSYPLPGNGKIESTEEECDECKTPKIKVISKGNRPWILCLDPNCPTKD